MAKIYIGETLVAITPGSTDSGGNLIAEAAYTKGGADTAISTAVTNLIDSAPGSLDTLNELAAAMNDDDAFNTTVTNLINLKAPLADPALTGTPTAPTATAGTNTTQIATTAFVTNAVSSEDTVAEMNDVTITSLTDGELLVSSSGNFVNKTLSEAGIAPTATPTFSGNATFGGNIIFNGSGEIDFDGDFHLSSDGYISWNGGSDQVISIEERLLLQPDGNTAASWDDDGFKTPNGFTAEGTALFDNTVDFEDDVTFNAGLLNLNQLDLTSGGLLSVDGNTFIASGSLDKVGVNHTPTASSATFTVTGDITASGAVTANSVTTTNMLSSAAGDFEADGCELGINGGDIIFSGPVSCDDDITFGGSLIGVGDLSIDSGGTLQVDTNVLLVNGSTNKVGINHTPNNSSAAFTVTGTVLVTDSAGDTHLDLNHDESFVYKIGDLDEVSSGTNIEINANDEFVTISNGGLSVGKALGSGKTLDINGTSQLDQLNVGGDALFEAGVEISDNMEFSGGGDLEFTSGGNIMGSCDVNVTGRVESSKFLKTGVYADATARDAAITSPQAGMIVFVTSGTKFQGYTGAAWVDFN